MTERQTPAQDQRCQSGQSAVNWFVPSGRRISQRLWGRPTTTADCGTSIWQIPWGNIQDRGMYLFTISYGSDAMDQRSGVGWFSGWFKFFVICKRNYSRSRLWVANVKIASAPNRIIHNSPFKRRVSLEEHKDSKENRSFEGNISLTRSMSTSWPLEPTILLIITPTYLRLFFEMMIFRNSIQNRTKFYFRWHKSHLMQTCDRQSNVWNSQRLLRVTLKFETRILRSDFFAQVNLISCVTPTLRNLRIGLRRRQSDKSKVPAKQRGSWPKECLKKKHERATFFSPSENWCLPASTRKPEEREFVVDSGASMHMISKKELSDAERIFWRNRAVLR